VATGTVFVGSDDNNVYALDASDGSFQWSSETAGLVRSSPTVADGTVFVAGGDTVYALDKEDGTEQWSFTTADTVVQSSPTVANGRVLVGGSDTVHALDADDGTEQWSFATGSDVRSSPTVAEGTAFVGSNNNVYALDTGITGFSEGSRVNLGTLGHHHGWNGGRPTVVDYANDDGIVVTIGLLRAIDDWRNDGIDKQLLFAVIDAWQSKTPVI